MSERRGLSDARRRGSRALRRQESVRAAARSLVDERPQKQTIGSAEIDELQERVIASLMTDDGMQLQRDTVVELESGREFLAHRGSIAGNDRDASLG